MQLPDVYDLEDINLLLSGEHRDPHRCLGLHTRGTERVALIWSPGASELFLEYKGHIVPAQKMHDGGLFAYRLDPEAGRGDYRVYHTNGSLVADPYTFTPTIGELDGYLFANGVHYELYKRLGGRLCEHEGVYGAKFTVWAPNAKRVSLVGDFNHWDGRRHPMRALGAAGIWELFVPGLQEGDRYKFEVKTQTGELLLKADPMGYSGELRPATASILFDVERFIWRDDAWMDRRQRSHNGRPMAVYEVHLGSWKRPRAGEANYRELGGELIAYCKEMGFTHVELLPVAEHPLDESWGYQVSGYYAATSRFGTPEDFQFFVNELHKNGIGVLLDWVPGHFPSDDFSLGRFDGTCLYEHADPRQGYHPHWNTLIFNYGRKEVSNFLIANALFWLREMHVDGLRVDAVASMLYLDYGRKEGEWIPNQAGGKENLEAIEFLKHLNSVVHERHPGALMIAEESTSFMGVTHDCRHGGLGFDLKWSMGWMNDTLFYFQKDPLFRHYHQTALTFGLLYAFSEKFLLVLSHDEVVHGKRSLLSKMPGDDWQKFANLRLLYSYMICHPGKKLLFMGGEIGQWGEWYCKGEIEWHLLQHPAHRGLQQAVREANFFYQSHAALWENDFDWRGFEWVDFSDTHNCVLCFRRKSSQGDLLCVHHFAPNYNERYVVHMPRLKMAREVFNSDEERFGGSGKVNRGDSAIVRNAEGHAVGLAIQLAPLATQIFEIDYE